MSIWDHLPWKKRSIDSPGAGAAYRRMLPPDPSFFSVLLTGVFMDERIGLNSADMDRLVASLPTGLQGQGKMWINLYLSWTLSKLVQEKYGSEFSAKSIEAISEVIRHLDKEETVNLCKLLSSAFAYWFPVFNLCLTLPDEPDCPPELKQSPHHFVAAYAILKHGPDGPLFLADEDAAQIAISGTLREALGIKLESYRRMVEIGAPLEAAK